MTLTFFTCVGMEKQAEVTFNSSMSEDNFFKWLRLRGVSDKDCKTLSGKILYRAIMLLLAIN